MTNSIGSHLIDRHTRMDIGTGRFADAHACEERAVGPRVIAGAIGTGFGGALIQSTQNLHVRSAFGKRLERPAQGEILGVRFRPPGSRNCAVGEENEC